MEVMKNIREITDGISVVSEKSTFESYTDSIKQIKNAILQSRYIAASLVNRELLSLYFSVGEFVSANTRKKFWGTGAIDIISERLQQEIPGLRGFSASNIKNMRLFYEEWQDYISIRQLPTAEIYVDNQELSIRQLSTAEIPDEVKGELLNRQLSIAELTEEQIELFLKVGFTHHREILRHCNDLAERLFYIERCATEFWSIEKLKYNLKSNLFFQKGKLQNNFLKAINDDTFRARALNSFKDEIFLDFINLEDPDDESDERVLENAIVNNIKKFIMALGYDFSFMGNQYRIIVDEEEFFIDLLFFNRRVQSLVAIELKKGKFKAEYAGKMNFYLSALDEYVKQPHENPSIGIILCKEKNNKVVEFAFRDTSKPMGVATYKTESELPEKYRNILPDVEKLKSMF
jgi:predicted nuclease of restriction endonuclease-like (RecB) superfamily